MEQNGAIKNIDLSSKAKEKNKSKDKKKLLGNKRKESSKKNNSKTVSIEKQSRSKSKQSKHSKDSTKQGKSNKSFTDSKEKGGVIKNLLSHSVELYSKAKILYNKFSADYNLEKNKFMNSEFRWTIKMVEKGTFEDKLSALCQHVKKSPQHCLSYLTEICSSLDKKNIRYTLLVFEALKDLFLNSVLENKKYMSFIDFINSYKQNNNTDNIPDTVIVEAYISDSIHKLYFSYITSLENYLKEDNVLSIKKQVMNILQELLKKRPEREEYLLDLIIYKLGDPKADISNQAILLLKNLQESHLMMSLVILKRLNSFINNYNIANEGGSYHALVLISQFKQYKNPEFVKYGLTMFFKLFDEYAEYEDERYYKFLEQIIKSIGFFYRSALMVKNVDNETFKHFFEEKINLLFKLSHSSSIKLRVQVLRLIFFLVNDSSNNFSFKKNHRNGEVSDVQSLDSLSDRYYKSLYELISLKEALASKNIKDYLKLIMSSLMSDKNSTRVLAMIKRLLQFSLLAEPPVICCILIIVSHVIHKNKPLWTYLYSLEFKTENESTHKKNAKKTDDEEGDKKKAELKESDRKYIENFSKRDAKYVLENSLIELTLLTNHYHPTIQKWTKEILERHSIETIAYEGDPLMDFSLVNFLHKFITKNPKLKNLKKKKPESAEDKETKNKESEQEKEEKIDFINKFAYVNKESTSIIKKKKKAKSEDIEDYADQIIENEIDRMGEGKADVEFSDNEEFVSDEEDYDMDEEVEEGQEEDIEEGEEEENSQLEEAEDSEDEE